MIIILLTIALTTLFNLIMMMVISNLLIKTKNEEINITPTNIITKHKEKKEYEIEQEKYKTISDNIDNYNGTSLGQKDIPKK